MAFSPDAPESPLDLYALFDDSNPDNAQVAFLIYESDDENFYRSHEKWKEFSNDDDTELDFDGLLVLYVTPAFTPVYDKAEDDNMAIVLSEVTPYLSNPVIDGE